MKYIKFKLVSYTFFCILSIIYGSYVFVTAKAGAHLFLFIGLIFFILSVSTYLLFSFKRKKYRKEI